MKLSSLFLIIVLFAFSCDSKNETVANKQEAPVTADSRMTPVSNPGETSDNNKIIKVAQVRFQVSNVSESTTNIQHTAGSHGAYIGEMNLESNETSISNHFVIRVPAAEFEALVEDLEKESIFMNYKKITADDVTEEFTDIESRLRTKKEVKERYEDILRNKAKTVEDVLKAEDQIRVLQEEIEAKEGRLQYLQSRTAYSTINLDIYQKVDFKETPDAFQKPYAIKAKEGFLNGWSVITDLGLALISIWPFTLIAAIAIWKRRWIRRLFSRN